MGFHGDIMLINFIVEKFHHHVACRGFARGLLGILFSGMVLEWCGAQDSGLPGSGKALKGHVETVYSVAFHPTIRQVVTGSFDKSVKVWDVNSGKEIKSFSGQQGHQQMVLSVAISPDGSMIASGGTDNTLKIWDYPSAQSVWKEKAGDGIFSCSSTPDGKYLAAGFKDGTVKFWKDIPVKDLKELPKNAVIMKGHTAPVTGLQILNNGQKIISSGNDGVIQHWNSAENKVLQKIGAHEGGVTSLLANSNGQVISAGNDGLIKYWNTQAKSVPETEVVTNAEVLTMAFSPDAAIAVFATSKPEIVVYKTNPWAKSATLPVSHADIRKISISADKKWLLAFTQKGALELWNLADGKMISSRLVENDGFLEIGFLGASQYFSAGKPSGIKVWNLPQGQLSPPLALPEKVAQAVSLDDGKNFAWVGASGQLRIGGNNVIAKALDSNRSAFVISENAKACFVGGNDGSLSLVTNDKKNRKENAHKGKIVQLAVLAGNIVSLGEDKVLKFWRNNFLDGKEPEKATPYFEKSLDGQPLNLTSQPAKSLAWIGFADGRIQAFQIADGKLVYDLKSGSGPVREILFSKDSGTLLAILKNGSLKSFDLKVNPPKELPEFAVGDSLSSAISGDGKLAAFLTPDGEKSSLVVVDLLARQKVFSVRLEQRGFGLQFQQDKKALQILFGDAQKSVPLDIENMVLGKFLALKNNGFLVLGEDGKNDLKTIPNISQLVDSIYFSPEVSHAAILADKTIKILKVDDGKELWVLPHPQKVLSVKFSSDKSRVASLAQDGIVRLWDVATGRQLEFYDVGGFANLGDFHPQGQSIFALSKDKKIHSLVLANSKSIASNASVRSLVFLPNGQSFAGICDDKTLKIWNINNGNVEKEFVATSNALGTVAFSPNNQLFVLGGVDSEVRIYQAGDQKLVGSLKTNSGVRNIQFQKENVLAVAGEDGSLVLYSIPFTPGQQISPDFGKMIQGFEIGNQPAGFGFIRESKAIFVADATGLLQEFKIAAETPVKNIPHPGFVDVVAFDSKGNLVATGCHDGKVRIVDVGKGAIVKEIEAHSKPVPSPVYSVLWSQDGKRVYSGAMDGSVKCHDASDGKIQFEIKPFMEKESENGHKDGVFALAMLPEKNILASAGSDRVIKFWNLQDGKFIKNLSGKQFSKTNDMVSHPGWIYSLRFTKDGGKLLASGAAPKGKGIISLWNPSSGELETIQDIGTGVVYSIGLDPAQKSICFSAGSGRQGVDMNPVYITDFPKGK